MVLALITILEMGIAAVYVAALNRKRIQSKKEKSGRESDKAETNTNYGKCLGILDSGKLKLNFLLDQ